MPKWEEIGFETGEIAEDKVIEGFDDTLRNLTHIGQIGVFTLYISGLQGTADRA